MKRYQLVMAAVSLMLAMPSAAQKPAPAEMPADILAMHEAAGGDPNSKTRCEVLDWIVDPANHWNAEPGGPVDVARNAANVCRLSHADITPEIAARRLGDQNFRFDIDGSVMTVLAKSDQPKVFFCCAPDADLSRLHDSNYWAARFRLADLDRAMITVIPPGPIQRDQWQHYRGPNAPRQPDEIPIGQWKGQVIEKSLRSAALGETRKLLIYLPPGYSRDRQWPALFMADAGAIEFGGLVESMIEAGSIKPIVIISADSGDSGIIGEAPTQFGDLRAAEYLPNTPKGAARFAPHMKFFSEEVVAYAISEFGVSSQRADRAVAGKSNGGVFALWAGVMHPEAFADAVSMSPGWKPLQKDDVRKGLRARFFLSAGLYEPPFIMSARNSEGVLRASGYKVEGHYFAAGHAHDQWVVALHDALLAVFPAR